MPSLTRWTSGENPPSRSKTDLRKAKFAPTRPIGARASKIRRAGPWSCSANGPQCSVVNHAGKPSRSEARTRPPTQSTDGSVSKPSTRCAAQSWLASMSSSINAMRSSPSKWLSEAIPVFRAKESPWRGSLIIRTAGANSAHTAGVSSDELLLTTTISGREPAYDCATTLESVRRSEAARLCVGTTIPSLRMLSHQPPVVRRIEITPDRLAGLDVERSPSVEPVDRVGAGAFPNRRADRVDARLQSQTRHRKFNDARSGLQRQLAAADSGALLAVKRSAVTGVVENLDHRIVDWPKRLEMHSRDQRRTGAGGQEFLSFEVVKGDRVNPGGAGGRAAIRVGHCGDVSIRRGALITLDDV